MLLCSDGPTTAPKTTDGIGETSAAMLSQWTWHRPRTGAFVQNTRWNVMPDGVAQAVNMRFGI